LSSTYLQKQAVPIDFDGPYAANSFAFLNGAVGEASIVELGESIHVTAERRSWLFLLFQTACAIT
jgi:hypothetical protein